jgi:murein DD-endopeptidase MepM/ murein hydrolase activator NlpD
MCAGTLLPVLCLGQAAVSASGTLPSATAAPPSAVDVASTLSKQGVDFSYEIYQVCEGDTVENIAARFGVSAARIRQFNNLADATLTSGDAIAIPIGASAAPPKATKKPALQLLEPRYGISAAGCVISSEPNGGGEVLHESPSGSQLIVSAEHGDFWGVVMIDGSTGWVPKAAVGMTDQKLSPDQLETMLKGGRPDVVQEAFRYLGTPYRYGGSLPHDVDCSLLVQTVFRTKGVSLPRTASAQWEVGQLISYRELLPGDRLYFVSRSGRINHTGIYIGGGKFIHASSRRGCVAVDALYDRLYWSRFLGARRS